MATLKVLNERGRYHDDHALYFVLNYIQDHGKAQSGLIGGWAVYPPNVISEMTTFSRLANKESGVRLRHFVISFSPDRLSSPEKMFQIANECAKYYGDEYQIVFSVHEDRKHLHAHFVMNTISYRTGLKYPGKKKDFYRFIKHCEAVFKKYKLNENLMWVRKQDDDSDDT